MIVSEFDSPEESRTAFDLISEADPFRLIRGHASVEETLDRAIDAAFRAGTPPELKNLRLPARLALAEALELVTEEVVTAIKALAMVRNRLAHGGDDLVTVEEIRTLRAAFQPFDEGSDVELDDWSEDAQLRIIVAGIWQATYFTVEYALDKRAELDMALAAWRKRGALSVEELGELLADSDLELESEEDGGTNR